MGRRYRYVGPEQVRRAVAGEDAGAIVRAGDDLARLGADSAEPFTYVIDLQGNLRLADRRSEHVACAGGEDVLAAGEIAFDRDGDRWRVAEVSNQSTGYCPEPSSWDAVARALDAIGAEHAGGFTHALVFRRCESCGERNIVKDETFVCDVCGADLPLEQTFDRTTP